MSTQNSINSIQIKGFKSIKDLPDFKLNQLNILIGANGSGKSNFISFFRMLSEIVAGRLQIWTEKQGGADRILSYGIKETPGIEANIRFGLNGYKFELEPTVDSKFVFTGESMFFDGPRYGPTRYNLGSGHSESKLKEKFETTGQGSVADYCYQSVESWKIFHFHDTSDTAGVKRSWAAHDNDYLRPSAENLAAYLYRLKQESPDVYQQIRKTIQLAIPFFDDFYLRPVPITTGEEFIALLWRQKDSDYSLWPSQLSDGSIRFICLVTALMQPTPPSTLIIDEPELGLHPYAITLLASLIRSASKRMQIIISTQSVPLVNEFSVNDLIIVEREKGNTVFKRYDEENYKGWLEEYTVGELWEKNILGGRPQK